MKKIPVRIHYYECEMADDIFDFYLPDDVNESLFIKDLLSTIKEADLDNCDDMISELDDIYNDISKKYNGDYRCVRTPYEIIVCYEGGAIIAE